MSAHQTQYGKISSYLQDQLAGEELAEFQAHVATCPLCSKELQQERALSNLLSQSFPLYEAPEECAESVRNLLAEHRITPPVPTLAMPASLETLPKARRSWRLPLFVKGWRILIPLAAAFALCLFILSSLVQQSRASSYIDAAVNGYHQVAESRLSFGIRSDSPKEITAWISERVPFHFRLPASGKEKQTEPAYHLAGASLLEVKGHPAALITYTKQAERVTLLVASDQYATVAGGHQIQHQDLMFHYFNVDGATVITWRNHGLSYALVTSRASSKPELKPCLVCHQNMLDRRFFQTPRSH